MNLEDDILIERFLRNELSEKEKNNFLKRVDTDEDFKSLVAFEKQLFETLNEEDWSFIEKTNSKEVAEYIQEFEKEETQQLKKIIQETNKGYKNKKTKVIQLISSFAAVVLLLITLNVFLNSSVDTNQLYADNKALNELPSFTTRGNDNENALIQGENFFKEKKYKESLAVFDKVLLAEKENSSVFIYKAVAHTELNQYKEGEIVLDKLINSDLIDAEKGYWYKSLIYVKSNQLKKAKTSLKKIIENSYYNTKKAKTLLEKL